MPSLTWSGKLLAGSLVYTKDARKQVKVPGRYQFVVTKGREAMGEECTDTALLPDSRRAIESWLLLAPSSEDLFGQTLEL